MCAWATDWRLWCSGERRWRHRDGGEHRCHRAELTQRFSFLRFPERPILCKKGAPYNGASAVHTDLTPIRSVFFPTRANVITTHEPAGRASSSMGSARRKGLTASRHGDPPIAVHLRQQSKLRAEVKILERVRDDALSRSAAGDDNASILVKAVEELIAERRSDA